MSDRSGNDEVEQRDWPHLGEEAKKREIGTTNWRYKEEGEEEEEHTTDRHSHAILNRIRGILLLIIMIMGILSILGGWYAFTIYDGAHHVPVVCTVKSANGGSARFVGGVVNIETSDCGPITLVSSAVGKNPDVTASKFQRGHRYEFEMGAVAHKSGPLLKFLRTDPNVYSFREVGS